MTHGRRVATPGEGPAPGSSADEVAAADPVDVARTIALHQLTLGPRSRHQLESALARRGVPDETARAVLDRFADVGLVDDGAFAQAWVDTRHRGRGLGRRALAHELRDRGVDPAVAQAALDSLGGDVEVATARALVDRRIAATRGLPVSTRFRRLAGMLARKGYPPAVVHEVVRSALAAEVGPDGPVTDLVDG